MSEKLHIIPHNHAIKKQDRNQLNKHQSFVVWFVGLSGSGKSTVANAVEQQLHARGVRTYILDGDNIRSGLNKDLDFSEEGRIENLRRIGEVAHLFVESGTVVLTAFITPFKEERARIKEIIGAENLVEVFVDCPIEVCEQRDVKGLYAKARAGEIKNFTGISSPFEHPENPDVTVNTDKEQLEESVLNQIDKLGHVDFSYDVSSSQQACKDAL